MANVRKLRDGTEVLLRLLQSADTDKLHAFFMTLSENARQFLYDDVTDRAVVEKWTSEADFDNVLPIVALSGGEIVADGTLHKRNNGPSRHIGRIRVVVRDDFLGRGLGTVIANELSVIAKARKLSCLYVTVAEKSDAAAIEVVQNQGFVRTAVLPNFLIDRNGNFENAVVLVKNI